jgi:ABC-type dipeptide/oligopeptide/nickel transport system permease subunit
MTRHIFPQVLPLIIIVASAAVAVAIIVEASLSFLGLGVQPPVPSWGNMLSGPGRAYLETAPWLVMGPGVAISLTVLSFNLLGDSLRDVLDPRLRGSRK